MTQERPISEVPTASSIYSQPSSETPIPEMNITTPQNHPPPRSSSLYTDDVSPPSSPHTNNGEMMGTRRDSPEVSPISDSPASSVARPQQFGSGRFNSNLPIAKKTRKFWNRPSLEAQDQGSTLTHWDVYSGEPTTSEKGKPPSTTPSAVKLTADPMPGKIFGDGFGTSTHISGGTPPIGRKRVASRDQYSSPIIRPEWKGAGGRHAIVKPMLDKPLPPGKAPSFPAGREKYEQEQKERDRELKLKKEERLEAEAKRAREVERENEKEKEIEKETLRRKEREKESERECERERKMEEERKMEAKSLREAERPPKAEHTSRSLSPTPQMLNLNKTIEANQPSIIIEHQGLKGTNGFTHLKSEDSTRTSTPPMHPQLSNGQAGRRYDPLLAPEDRRSPLARNPSNEEMKNPQPRVLTDLYRSNSVERSDFGDDQATVGQGEDILVGSRLKTSSDGSVKKQDGALNRSDSVIRSIPETWERQEDSSQVETKFRANLQHMNLQDEPPSRFSTTTYATTIQDSPPASPELGSYSPAMSSMANTPNSILNRKRPVPPAGPPNSKGTARKPTPAEITNPPQSVDTKRKSLPKSPPEKQAVSRIAGLEAKLDNLRRRRNNLQTVIHELTHVVQPSSIAYDMASRQEIKRTVGGLNKELAEVIKDEHETGIKLHRAKKREDEFGQYEPTSIWVRRVTS